MCVWPLVPSRVIVGCCMCLPTWGCNGPVTAASLSLPLEIMLGLDSQCQPQLTLFNNQVLPTCRHACDTAATMLLHLCQCVPHTNKAFRVRVRHT